MNMWLFDLGNTRLKCTRLRPDGELGEIIALPHAGVGHLAALHDALAHASGSACLASVASASLTADIVDVLSAHFSSISLARSQACFAGVSTTYAPPSRLGVDRFLALVAARARAAQPGLVVGVGTALTIDLLAADGRHQGGLIAPSPGLMRSALHGAASQLPERGGTLQPFALNTEDALASGSTGAALGLIERSLRQATQALGDAPRLLLHGGGAADLLPMLAGAIHAPSLVLEGLALWAQAGVPTAGRVDRIPAC